jgi:aldose 1-epimerase
MDLGARDIPAKLRRQRARSRFTSSGRTTPILVGLLCAVLLAISYNHTVGNFHRLKSAVLPAAPPPPVYPRFPGGQAPVVLSRSATALGAFPEFLSAKILPGRGMQILQIKALLPSRGETSIFFAPDDAEALRLLTDTGADANGALSPTIGSSLGGPWAERIFGAQNGQIVDFTWLGHKMQVPGNDGISVEGLLLDRGPMALNTQLMADGQSVEALIHSWGFATPWMGLLDFDTKIELSGQAIDVTVTATNVGKAGTPVGLGWKPIFNLSPTDREMAMLVVPSREREATDARTGLPLGHSMSVAGTDADFSSAGGTPLGSRSVNATYVNLQRAVMADGPMVELLNPAANFGLRMIPLSDSITAVHIKAPNDKPWVSMEAETNQMDPFGREWTGPDGSGIQVLEPGQSMRFRVRLEIFALEPKS